MGSEHIRDRYDQEVERLTAEFDYDRGAIERAWGMSAEHHSPLFDMCGAERDGDGCGCPSMIRSGGFMAGSPALTNLIKNDKRIPELEWRIFPEHLPAFADIQRMVDRELGRTPPPMLPEPTAPSE